MILDHDGSTYTLTRLTRYEEILAKNAKFTFAGNGLYLTSHWLNASLFYMHATPSARALLDAKQAELTRSVNASYQTSSTLTVPAPAGLHYYPYQIAGIEYAMQRDNTLIADEPGLGKTIQAIGMINLLLDIRKTLVICPASLKVNWSKELRRWLVDKGLTVGLCAPGKLITRTNVVIINYDLVKRYITELQLINWDLIVCDESHYLKNWTAQRTKAVTKLKGRRNLWLTGTPVLNRPIELWTTVSHLTGDTNFKAFQDLYAGYQGKTARNLDDLQHRLRRSIMVRRLKSDVLAELPPKQRQIIELPADPKQLKIEHKRLKALLGFLPASGTDQWGDAVKSLQRVTTNLQEIARLRLETARIKLPAVLDAVADQLSADHKIVLFAHHLEILHAFHDRFKSHAVILTGEHNDKQKNQAVESFQTDPNVWLFVGSIKAAGVGLTLTASSHAIFAELDWSPGIVTQAEDRLHRIGQADNVLIQHYVIEDSIDCNIARMIVDKQKVIDAGLSSTEQYIKPNEREIWISSQESLIRA